MEVENTFESKFVLLETPTQKTHCASMAHDRQWSSHSNKKIGSDLTSLFLKDSPYLLSSQPLSNRH